MRSKKGHLGITFLVPTFVPKTAHSAAFAHVWMYTITVTLSLPGCALLAKVKSKSNLPKIEFQFILLLPKKKLLEAFGVPNALQSISKRIR